MIQTALKRQETMMPQKFNHTAYIQLCLDLAEEKAAGAVTMAEIKSCESDINAYANIDSLEPPRNLCVLEDEKLGDINLRKAVNCVLDGKLFSEHAAAGEATRLGLGTKYLINIPKDLSLADIAKRMTEETGKTITEDNVREIAGCEPNDLLPLSLGERHMLQYAFDIRKLAIEKKRSPEDVLARQKMLIVLNEETAETILKGMRAAKYFGFSRGNVFFMIQKSYHGISLNNGLFYYDQSAPRRLHNHGQIFIQQTMQDQIFNLDKDGRKVFLAAEAFGEILKGTDDKMNYNIDDFKFLLGAIDFMPLALALKKGEEGYGMLMEIVANDPEHPQKGGMAAFDTKLNRNVMVEGFQLKGIKNHEIKYLNKNINHFPKPYKAWQTLKEKGLNMPIAVKDDYLYFQPVQGDVNFLVKTEFFLRKELRPIRAWKSNANTPLAMKFMYAQDQQDGFRAYAEKFFDLI